MKTILMIYLKQYLLISENGAAAIVHAFVMFAYFFPLIGAILSDSFLGKFRTIVYLSLIYSLGNIILALTAIPGVTGNPPHWY
jgi:dipeptide/tripeptide permease